MVFSVSVPLYITFYILSGNDPSCQTNVLDGAKFLKKGVNPLLIIGFAVESHFNYNGSGCGYWLLSGVMFYEAQEEVNRHV